MMGNEGISVADALALRNSGNGSNGFSDGDGAWWIIILILLFGGGGYQGRGRYYVEGDYGNRGGYNNRGGGNYNGYNRMKEHLDRINDGVEMYDYGRERYQHGDSEERIYEGLEKLMYAVCMFVESTMDFAETPEEKDIIRRHVQKMSSI